MNFERSRLRTFQSWPSNSPVSSKRIAKAGFFYTGHQHEVQCFACGVKISNWTYNDSVMAKHRAKDPGCPFVKNPEASGNVSIENEEVYKLESGRLATFNNWPVSFIVTPEALAKTGFYYLKQGDKVKCAYCSVIIGRWEQGDNAESEHKRQSPNCPFLARDNQATQANMINLRALDEDMRDLGVQNHRVPKHPNLSTLDSRVLTFTTWPRDSPLGPQSLAVAGFFYDGQGDWVRCFHCDGGLRKWTAMDEPWSEHARWFPECHFVMLVKGEQFIEDTIKANPPITDEVFFTPKFFTKAPNKRIKVTNEQIQEFMSSPPAIAALQMGLDSSRVKTAIRQRLESSGSSFSSAHSLMEAALDVQFDENNEADDVWGTPPDSPTASLPAPRENQGIINNACPNIATSPQGARDEVTTDTEASATETEDNDTPVEEEPEPVERPEGVEVPEEPPVSVEEESSAQAVGASYLYDNPLESYEDPKPNESLEEEVRRLREARLCKICMDKEVGVVLLPCGHLVTCVLCASSLPRCPVCRENIKATVRTFLS
ncbi:hypothetical protein M8J76_006408 [Diaphorina citri]|nr:hypothetical protein M8J75_005785 [Diaphorina citri]KAI5740714.1 hypothetical protein M8J76_006408 [Diaphorina citri]